MTKSQIKKKNKAFRDRAKRSSKLIISNGTAHIISILVNGVGRVNACVDQIPITLGKQQWLELMGRMEDEIEENRFVLKQLEIINKRKKLSCIDEIIEEAYDLLSLYLAFFESREEKQVSLKE